MNIRTQTVAASRVATALLSTGIIFVCWGLASLVFCFALGAYGSHETEIVLDVRSCEFVPEVQWIEGTELRQEFIESSDGIQGSVILVGDETISSLQLVQSEAMDRARSDLHDAGCKISNVTLSQETNYRVELIGWATLLSALLVYLVAARRQPSLIFQEKNVRPLWLFLASAFGVILAVILGVLANSISSNLSSLSIAPGPSNTLHFLLVGVFVFPISEEVIFRKLALQVWIDKGLSFTGLFATSVAFAGSHLLLVEDNLYAWVAVASFLVSIGSGLVYLSAQLRGSIIFHASYNATILVPLLI